MPPALSVSLVIPVYNEQDVLVACLQAVFDQRIPVDEIIVVDNNSTDATGQLLVAYENRVLILHEPRQGVQHARAAGMDAARGDIIARIDADTRLPSGWVGALHAVFADPRVAGVTGPAHYYDIALARLISRGDLLMRRAWAGAAPDGLDWIFGANMALRATAWRQVRPELCGNAAVHEDQDLGMHLYAAGLRVVFARELIAATSARRIRDRLRDFRAYLAMTENGYRTHAGQTRRHSRLRAWLLTRVLVGLYFPLRLLHRLHLRRMRVGAARKHPMAAATTPSARS